MGNEVCQDFRWTCQDFRRTWDLGLFKVYFFDELVFGVWVLGSKWRSPCRHAGCGFHLLTFAPDLRLPIFPPTREPTQKKKEKKKEKEKRKKKKKKKKKEKEEEAQGGPGCNARLACVTGACLV